MAEIVQRPKIEVSATMLFSEVELRALDALVGYGVEGFLKVFYEKMGKHYMQPHEAGLRSLFESVRCVVPGILRRTDDAHRVFSGERNACHPDMPDRLTKAGNQIVELNAQLSEARGEIARLQEQLDSGRSDRAAVQEADTVTTNKTGATS